MKIDLVFGENLRADIGIEMDRERVKSWYNNTDFSSFPHN